MEKSSFPFKGGDILIRKTPDKLDLLERRIKGLIEAQYHIKVQLDHMKLEFKEVNDLKKKIDGELKTVKTELKELKKEK